MALNDIGSLASIISLVALIIGGCFSVFKRCRNYLRLLAERDEDFKDMLVSAISLSTTTSQRSDAAAFVGHTVGMMRHEVIKGYFRLLLSIALGLAGYFFFFSVDMPLFSWASLFMGAVMSLLDYLFVTRFRRKMENSESEVSKALAKHVDGPS